MAGPASRSIGIGGILLGLLAWYFASDANRDIRLARGPQQIAQPVTAPNPPDEHELARFVSVVLADTTVTWTEIFRATGGEYREPELVLYTDVVQSTCGLGQSAMGPFYCPPDEKLYIDLGFYRELKDRFHAPGDFAQAYVIAHEIAHHVQNLTGVLDRVYAEQRRSNPIHADQLSVRLELQADCFAGVWTYHAHSPRHIFEAGDIEEVLNATAAVGDDQLQTQPRYHATPDSFTHGSSAQRVRWFTRGMETGDLAQCNTFDGARL